jgi:O-antigen/teichoic acid export membrane protein
MADHLSTSVKPGSREGRHVRPTIARSHRWGSIPIIRQLGHLLPKGAGSATPLLHHSVLALGISLLGAFLAFVAQVSLAHAMGVRQYGTFAYVFVWISLLSHLATLGFQQSLLRFASVFRERGEFGALCAVVGYAERCSLIASAAIVLSVAGALWLFRGQLPAELVVTFAVGLPVVPAIALMRVRSSFVRVFGRIALSLVPDTALRELILAIAAGAILVGALSTGYAWVAMGFVLLASVLGLATVSVGQRRLMPAGERSFLAAVPKSAVPDGAARAWLRPALFLLLFTTANLLVRRTDILVIGWLLGTEQAGVYAVAMYLAGLVTLPVTAIGTAFAPAVAALHAEQRMAALQERASSAARWGVASGLAPGLALLILSPTVLAMIGDAYVVGSDVLRILVVGNVLAAAAGPVQLLMTMTGDEGRAAVLHLAFAAINVCVMVAFVNAFGMEGGALATVVVVISFKVALIGLVHRRIGIWSAPVGAAWLRSARSRDAMPSVALLPPPPRSDAAPWCREQLPPRADARWQRVAGREVG